MDRASRVRALGCCALLCAAVASGAPAAAPAPSEDVVRARVHFDQGITLYERGKYREAIEQFEFAYKARAHPSIFFNLAQCHEKVGDVVAALTNYRRYREFAPAAERAELGTRIAALEASAKATVTQPLKVTSEPAGAEVRIDGAVRGRTPHSEAVKAGTYELSVNLSGHRPASQRVTTTFEKPTEVALVLEKLPVVQAPVVQAPVAQTPVAALSASAAQPLPAWLPWAAFGAGAASVGYGVFHTIGWQISRRNQVAAGEGEAAASYNPNLGRLQTRAIIGYAAAAASAVAGTFLLNASQRPPAVVATFSASPGAILVSTAVALP